MVCSNRIPSNESCFPCNFYCLKKNHICKAIGAYEQLMRRKLKPRTPLLRSVLTNKCKHNVEESVRRQNILTCQQQLQIGNCDVKLAPSDGDKLDRHNPSPSGYNGSSSTWHYLSPPPQHPTLSLLLFLFSFLSLNEGKM